MAELFELTGNMHMHTPYSDGKKWHAAIADDAIQAGSNLSLLSSIHVMAS